MAVERTPSAALYAELEALLKDAEQGAGRGAQQARALRKRWLDLTADQLLETALVLGSAIGIDFDRGVRLMQVAEDEADGVVPARGYAALMRLGVSTERHREVLGLLARARVQGATASPGVLLSGMQAAAALGDWGAVARLAEEYECADGCPAGADGAVPAGQLELMGSPEVLAELEQFMADGAPSAAAAARATDGLAQTLALRAHCERGDAERAVRAIEALRELGWPLDATTYRFLLELAQRGARAPLLALRPVDLARSAAGGLEPRLVQLRSAPTLLRNEDVELVIVALGLGLLLALGLLSSTVLAPQPVDPLAAL